MIIIKKITIKDIGDELYEACLDTEYREALAQSMMTLGYVRKAPFELYFGSDEERKELEEVENKPLTSNEISELIHLMMYEMRNDFQYGEFKPIITKFLNISKEMKKIEQETHGENKRKKKIKCNIYGAYGDMREIIKMTSEKLKKYNRFEESREMIERATESYSYDDAFNIINEYVDTYEKKGRKKEYEEEFE